MKWLAGIFLLSLLCVFPAQAIVFPCSADSSTGMLTGSGMQNMGAIVLKTQPTGALVTLDPGLSTIYSAPSTLALGEDPGTHSFTVSLAGYQDYSGQFAICTQKITYVTIVLVPGTVTTTTLIRLARTARPTTLTTTIPLAGITTVPAPAGTTSAVSGSSFPDDTGALSVSSTPSGAIIFLDGVQKAVSPAVIPGISPGDHTVQLKMDGYKVLSTSIRIRAGDTAEFSSGLLPDAPATTVAAAITGTTEATAVPPTTAPAAAVPTTAKSPGFAIFTGIGAITVVLALRRTPR